jgi:Zn-dependent protease with chaperone function
MQLTLNELHALVAHELSHFRDRQYYLLYTVEANHLSEFRADAMAATLGYADALVSLLQKISLVHPDRESWSHPSHNQRIAALKKLNGGEA